MTQHNLLKLLKECFGYLCTKHQKKKQIKVSGSADIHDISKQTTVQELANRRRIIERDTVYVPTSGLFWLGKGTKQCVKLKTDEDFECALSEYTNKNGTISSLPVSLLTGQFSYTCEASWTVL